MFSPAGYCTCTVDVSIFGVCEECSAIQFFNVSLVKVRLLAVVGNLFNKTSTINGISFDQTNRLIMQDTSVAILPVGTCYLSSQCSTTGVIITRTNLTAIHNLTAEFYCTKHSILHCTA